MVRFLSWKWQPIHYALCEIRFFDYILLSWYMEIHMEIHLHDILDKIWSGLNVLDWHCPRTFSKDSGMTLILYYLWSTISRISFISNIFGWTKSPSLLEMSARQNNGWFYGFHWRVKGRLIFPFNELLGRKRVSRCLRWLN